MPSAEPTRKRLRTYAILISVWARWFVLLTRLARGVLTRGMRVAPSIGMMLQLDTEQTQVLRELLQNDLSQLRFETDHTDGRDYREMLHHRKDVIEAVLKQLARTSPSQESTD